MRAVVRLTASAPFDNKIKVYYNIYLIIRFIVPMPESPDPLTPAEARLIHDAAGKLFQQTPAEKSDADVVQATASLVQELRQETQWRSGIMMAAFADAVEGASPIAAATIRYMENLQDQHNANDRWDAERIKGEAGAVDQVPDPRVAALLSDSQ